MDFINVKNASAVALADIPQLDMQSFRAAVKNQLDEKPILDIYRMVRDDGYMEIDICFPLK